MRRPAGSWLEEVHSSLMTLQHMRNTARASVSHRIHCVGLVLHLGCILHGLELLEQMYFLFKCLCRGSRVRWANGEDGSPVVNFWFPSGSLLVHFWFASGSPLVPFKLPNNGPRLRWAKSLIELRPRARP